jgi:hypothetical protein
VCTPACVRTGRTLVEWSRQDIGSHVLTIRCTRKLLERLDVEASSVPLHPTNRLGDWYANLLFTGRARLIICVSERTLLPVFVEAGPPS